MDTRSSADLKKAIESLEAEKKAMAEKMKAMEDQIFENSVNRQGEDDNDTETSEEHKVKIVAMKLRKYASTWWANTCTKRERLGKTKNQRPVEYSREFEYLLMKCDLPEDDPQTLVRYLGGLDTRVANIVELYLYSSLDDLTCWPTRCFRCQGLGHIASECPNKKMITLAKYEGVDNSFTVDTTLDSVVDAEFVVEEVVGTDEGACLVVRRALTNAPDQGGNLQREAIFHTRCTIAQKVVCRRDLVRCHS
nr:hypothetical protein [Tanacetum cinerariifolium]